MQIEEISAEDFTSVYSTLKENTLLDVREKEEYEEMHLEKAQLRSLSTFSQKDVEAFNKEEPVYVICHAGGRSYYAAQVLKSWGFKKPINVKGGMKAACVQDLPIKKK